jgi:hypothetical protein
MDKKDEYFEIIRFRVPTRYAKFCEKFASYHPRLVAAGMPAESAAIAAVGLAVVQINEDPLPETLSANELAKFASKLLETFRDIEEGKTSERIKDVLVVDFDKDLDKATPRGEA